MSDANKRELIIAETSNKDMQRSSAFSEWRNLGDFGLGPEIASMPTSPDTVCLDTSKLMTKEPLKLDQAMLTFDPNMFAFDKLEISRDFDPFGFFESISLASSDDETQADTVNSLYGSPEPTSSIDAIERESLMNLPLTETILPNKKRTKKESTSPEQVMPPNKKIKSSPKNSRSRLPTSAYRGVSRCTKDGRWQARIRIAKEVVYLGRYPTEEQAARRYDEAARIHHGSSAMLNFVTPEDLAMGCKSVFSMENNATF